MNYKRIVAVTLLAFGFLFLGASAHSQTWSQLQTVGSPPVVAPDGSGYDAINNRLIVFFYSESGGQVSVLTNANGLGGVANWIQLNPTGAPPTDNSEASVVYDSQTNQLIVYGGCGGNCSPSLSEVYVLSNANGLGGAPVWSLSTTTPEEPRDNQSAVYNSSTKQMIAFGGDLAFFGTDQNDTRILFPANATASSWTTLTPAGTLPGVRGGHKAIYDQKNNVMTIFGGEDAATAGDITYYNDVWVLSDADASSGGTPTWTQLQPTGDQPPPRTEHSAVYDQSNNSMYVFGGFQTSVSPDGTQNFIALGDLWKLTHANGDDTALAKWVQIGQLGTPPGANYGHTAAFDHVNQRMIVFGGADRNEQVHTLTFILDLKQH